MCVSPMVMAATTFILGAAQSVMTYQSQVQQVKANNAAKAQNDQNALAAMRDQYGTIQTRDIQERQKASEEKTVAAIQATEARSTAATAAGEAGVSGLSVNHILADYYAKEGHNATMLDANYDMTRNYLTGELTAAENNAQSRVNSMRYQKRPSPIGLVLGLGSAGLDGFTAYNNLSTTRRA